MNPLYLIVCLSIFCNKITAQDLPWLIQPSHEYKTVEPFSEGYAVVEKGVVTKVDKKNVKTKRFFYIDKQGNLSKDHYQAAYSYSDGLASVQKDNEIWNFRKLKVPKKGESILMSGDYDMANNFQNGYAPVKKDDKWGFIKPDGQYLIPPIYEGDGVRYFCNNWAGVQKKGKIWIVNTNGEEKYILKDYIYINNFSESLAVVQDEKGYWGYIDTLGEEKIPVCKGREYAGPFMEGFAPVSDGGTNLSFINREGKVLFTFKNGTSTDKDKRANQMYDLHPFSNGLAAVKQGKWGFIDTRGKIVLPCEYDAVTRFSEGFAAVKKGDKWLYINPLGQVVREGDFKEAKSCTEGIAWVKTNDGWGALSMTEKLEIVWELPFKNKAVTAEMMMTAHLSSSRALQDFEFTCNDKVIKNSKFFQKNLLETTWKEPILLNPGRNVLKLTVRNPKQQESNECVIYYQPPSPAPFQYSAVMIANSNYRESAVWGELGGAPIRDADSIATVLQEMYRFRQIFTVHDATLTQMKAIFRDLTEYSDSTERILFFYAGHGDYSETLKQAYLVPVDGQSSVSTQFSASAYTGYVQKMPTKHLLSVIDACFAGSFILDAPPPTEISRMKRGSRTNRGSKVRKTPKLADQNDASTAKPVAVQSDVFEPEDASERLISRDIMSSGQRVRVDNESAFKEVFCKVLRQNRNAKLSARTLFERLNQEVIEKSELVPQIGVLPNAGSDGGAFIFRKKI